jgi:hypothetical protein
MALGDSARAQGIVARARGWNPDVIEGSGENIAAFNNVPVVNGRGDFVVGKIPGGPPDQTKGVPDGYDVSNADTQHDTWNTTYQSEPKVRRGTTNANPYPGMPGSK